MPKLPISPLMKDRTKLFNNNDDKTAAKKILNDIHHSISFFSTLIDMDVTQISDAYTHLGLLESYITELSKLTGYDGMVAQENARRYAELRKAHERIRELESKIGSQMSGTSVSAGIRHWDNVFKAWYEACGWHYAKVEISPYNLIAHLYNDTELEQHRHISDETIYNQIAPNVPFIMTPEHFDMDQQRFLSRILDTERNKTYIKHIIKTFFPNAYISEFKSHCDNNMYYLEYDVVISLEELDSWYRNSILSKQTKQES